MPEPTLLARAATHFDDALESLTFEEFDWALEEVCHGLAKLADLAVGTALAGALPEPGTLPGVAVMQVAALPTGHALVPHFERAAALLAGERSDAGRETLIADLVFEGSLTLENLARDLGRPEEVGLVELPRTESQPRGVHRREALQFLAASGLVSLAACARVEPIPEAATAIGPADDSSAVPSATVGTTTRLDQSQWPTSDPFLFCAYHLDAYPVANEEMGPAVSLAGRNLGRDFAGRDGWNMYHGREIPGFPRHPHRGFETVTVVRTGLLDHTDSMGATARYGGGDVQWLTAGGGIQHAEMFPLLNTESDNPLELFQVWLNLPAADKMVDSHFSMLWSESIPRVTVADSEGRETELTLVAGAYGDAVPPSPPPNSWASKVEADLAIWKIRLAPNAVFELPAVEEGTDRSLYLHEGEGARVGDDSLANLTRAQLDGSGPIRIEAGAEETNILLLQGRPIGEPVARRGPFVMNTQNEIREAYADYQATGFGGWPWTGDAPVHERTRGRFAQRPDGSVEEPG